MGSFIRARINFKLEEPCTSFDVTLGFETLGGQRICTAYSACGPSRVHEERVGEQTFVCEIPTLPLAPGEYRVTVGSYINREQVDFVADAACLSVIKSDYYETGVHPPAGLVLIKNHWTLADREAQVSS